MKRFGFRGMAVWPRASILAMAIIAGWALASPALGWEDLTQTGATRTVVQGEDGNPAFGQPFAFTDNRDGTITDWNTGLMWEKKDNSGSGLDLHDVSNSYPWRGTCSGSTFPAGECGTDADCPSGQTCNATDNQGTGLTIFKWVAALNAANFAGYCDWRIPNVRELPSIVDYGPVFPAVTTEFQGSGCSASCTDLTDPNCSCTAARRYWSATTVTVFPTTAWFVAFNAVPLVDLMPKARDFAVRAVRFRISFASCP